MSADANPVRRVPVLIIGAGPAGLAASLLLQSYGIRTLTVTRYRWTAHTPRAHHINPRTMELLREMGLEEAVVKRAMPHELVRNVTVCVSLAGEEIGRYATYHHGGPLGYIGMTASDAVNIPQHYLEMIMAESFLSRGGQLDFNTECIAITQHPDKACARLRDRETGHEYSVEADYVIGADGANSLVAREIGLEFEGEVGWGAAINVWIRADLTKYCAHRPGVMYWTALPGNDFWVGSGTFIAVEPWNEWVVSFMYDPKAGEVDTSPKTLIPRIHKIIGDDSVDIEIISAGKWLMNGQYALQYSAGRVFCLGDAVRRHSPANGLGANTSMLDAYNLAWKLKLVLEGASPKLLESYNQERQPVGKSAVRRSMQSVKEFTAIASAIGYKPGQNVEDGEAQLRLLHDPGMEGKERRANLQKAFDILPWQFGALGMEMGYRYETGLVAAAEGPVPQNSDPDLIYVPSTVPGVSVPHAWLATRGGRISTTDITGRGKFRLLSGVGGEVWRSVCAEIAAEMKIALSVILIGPGLDYMDPYGQWRALRAVEDDGCILVRPDRHIAWRAMTASDTNIAALKSVVTALLAGTRGKDSS